MDRIKQLYQDRRSRLTGIMVILASVFSSVVLYRYKYAVAIVPLLALTVLALLKISFKGKKTVFKDIYLFALMYLETVYFFQLLTLIDVVEDRNLLFLACLMHNNLGLLVIPLILAFYLLLRAFGGFKVTAAVAPLPFALLTITDYYVANNRGHELLFSDLRSIRTAINVSGNYSYNPIVPAALVLVPFMLTLICAFNLEPVTSKRKIWVRIVLAAAAVCSFAGFIKITDNYFDNNKLETFDYNGSYYNTYYVNFTGTALKSIVVKPDGYSVSALDEEMHDVSASLPEDAPNIIVIMNESYSDLSIYEDTWGEFPNPDPFWDSLSENTIHGYALSSVYGGNTANSEFEFLTGLSMSFFPDGTVVYNQFINNELPSLPRLLGSLGYETNAVHPYYSDGWKRTTVYPLLGFDNMTFIEDMDYETDDVIRTILSDEYAYRDLLNRCDSDEGLGFYFLITIQNHGGYLNEYNGINFTPSVYIDDPAADETNNFLTLIHESDIALEYLFDELSQRDEKYIVLVFGDHQPSLPMINDNSDFGPGGRSWVIPYIIWANYDMDPELINELDHTEDYTSINYLSLDLMRAAGITPDSYFDLLYRIEDEVPAINVAGYRLNGENVYHPLDEITDNHMLSVYQYLTYDVMFDNDEISVIAPQ